MLPLPVLLPTKAPEEEVQWPNTWAVATHMDITKTHVRELD